MYLTPGPPSDDGRRTPVFWGYVLTPYTISTMIPLLDANRLALIFDLDETLLIANTVSSLEKRMEDCQLSMWVLSGLWLAILQMG